MKQSVVNHLSIQDKVCHDTMRTKESKESIQEIIETEENV